MSGLLGGVGRRLLFKLDPETAHGLAVAGLKSGIVPKRTARASSRLAVTVAGLDFANPLGMAAGFDKNAEIPDALLALGFGFVEVGTITPLAQPGNPRPRIFRLEADEAVINRLGFNNEGHEAAHARLVARKSQGGIVGINVGANKESADRIADYAAGIERFSPLASYLTVNISSPNTPGLRDLQGRASLAALLSRVRDARDGVQGRSPPIFLKIAPDLTEVDLDDIAAEVLEKGIEGVIVSNTTLSRDGLTSRQASEAGGVSGRPIFARSTAVLARMRLRLGRQVAIIGVGGIDSAETALEKIRAGADLVQIYTGMIYGGPGLPSRIVSGMDRLLEAEGVLSVASIRDSACERWAAQTI